MTRSTKQAVKVELYYSGAWHDLVATDDVYTEPPIVISHGGGEEGAAQKPNRVVLSIANDDDKYRPSNPTSPLYGLVGRNTPCRVSVGTTVRVIGEASFEPDQSDDFRASPRRGKRWVGVDAAGLLQRVNQWTDKLRSAFRVFNDGVAGVAGYWPMEDTRGATVARSAIPGTANINLVGQSFGSQNSPPGGDTGIDVQAISTATFLFSGGNPATTAGWQYSVCTFFGDLSGPAQSSAIQLETLSKQLYYLFIDQTNGLVNLTVIDDVSNATLLNLNFSTGNYKFGGKWIMWRAVATQSGGNVTYGVSWRAVGDPSFVGVSGSFAGITSDLWFAGCAGFPEGSTYGHVMGTRGVAEDLSSDPRWDAFLGHPGEQAASRFGRLCDQQGVPYYVSLGSAGSMPMGPQRVDTFAGHLEEIAKTDDALIYDHPTDMRLYMLCRADRYAQTPTLTLDASNNTHLAYPPTEVLNDLDPHNIVTAAQREGGDYTLSDTTSPMGTAAPPAGVGEYKQTVDVNLADEANGLVQVASWWLTKGTLNKSRFPQVTVDLVAAPALIPAVEATDTGSVLQIINFRENPIRMHVLGWQEKLGTHTRTVTFTCALDDVYNPGVINTGVLQNQSTVLGAALDATSTTLTFLNANPYEEWKPGVSGVHVFIGGEEITLGTIGARTGTNPFNWTVTGCTRSVNGIVKPHVFADKITIKSAIRLTL